MTTPRPGAGHLTDLDLPAPIAAALDDVEAGLTDIDAGVHPAEQALADDVTRYVQGRVHDPITRALLSRPRIIAWCVHEAVRQTEPESRRDHSTLYRKAEPLAQRADPAGTGETVDAPPKPTGTRRPRGDAKEKRS